MHPVASRLTRRSRPRTNLLNKPLKKFINNPDDFVPDVLDGILRAHPEALGCASGERHCVVRADSPIPGKVGIATGGGSGHLPVFLGYVGKGLLDGCAVGDVFAAPSAHQIFEVTKKIHGGQGVLYLYGNYGGDRMNFEMASEMARLEGIEVRSVLVNDDVASAPREEASRRRGVAGMVFAFKVAGAKADLGGSLADVEAVARKAVENIRTMGVALAPCTIPAAGRPGFIIEEGQMEVGLGIHGEPGVARENLKTADEIAERLAGTILTDLNAAGGDKLAVMINGLGATPLEELYILYAQVHRHLVRRDLVIHRTYVGEYATSMEMVGASVTLFRLDDEMAALLDHPAQSPFFVQA